MFKRAVLLGAAIAGRSTSSLFYTLLYREIFRKVYDHSDQNGAIAVRQMFNIGLAAANESAMRQEKVFKLFPASPEKLLEFIELLWQLVFGMPMEDFVTEKDYSDPLHPKLFYRIKKNPLIFGMSGDDPLDKFPWEKISDGYRGYSAGIVGMMMAATSNILRLKGSDKRIVIYDSKSMLRGDPYLELSCQIVDELPNEDILKSEIQTDTESEEEKTKAKADFFSKFDISSIDDLFRNPKQFIAEQIGTVIRNQLKMEPFEFFDHFANYEPDIYRIFGYLFIHGLNEKYRFVESVLISDETKRLVGYMVKEYQNNFFNYFPDVVIDDYRLLFISLLETRLAPPHMVDNFRNIDRYRMIDLFFEGLIKALSNLGVPFDKLKTDFWVEMQETLKSHPETTKENEEMIDRRVDLLSDYYKTITTIAMVINQALVGITHAVATASGEMILQNQSANDKLFDELKQNVEKLTQSLKGMGKKNETTGSSEKDN